MLPVLIEEFESQITSHFYQISPFGADVLKCLSSANMRFLVGDFRLLINLKGFEIAQFERIKCVASQKTC